MARKTARSESAKLSDRSDFNLVMEQVCEAQEAGALHWRLSSIGIMPRLNDDQITQLVGEAGSESRELFDKILGSEVVRLLDRVARVGPPLGEDSFNEAELDEWNDRKEKVREHFFTESLKQRIRIRETTKGTVLEEMRWEIAKKYHDLDSGTIPELPFARIEFRLGSSGQRMNPFAFFQSPQFVTFDCHLDDIETLLKDLQQLRDSLAAVGEEGAQ